MKKRFMLMLLSGLLLGMSSGVFAEESIPIESVPITIETPVSALGSLNTGSTVVPDMPSDEQGALSGLEGCCESALQTNTIYGDIDSATEWAEANPGWENSPELSVGCYKVLKGWLANNPDATLEEMDATIRAFDVAWWNEYQNYTKEDVYKRNLITTRALCNFYDTWSVQGEVSAAKITRVLELLNIERAKFGAPPLKLDQKLTDNALIRAAENNIYFNHDRPGGGFADYLAGGSEILCVGGDTPEQTVEAWVKSGSHYNCVIAKYNTVVGIGQVNDSWVCLFGDDLYESRGYYKPADSAFLKAIEASNRIDDVIVAHEILQPKILPLFIYTWDNGGGWNKYINDTTNTIDRGKTAQLGARIKTDYWKEIENYAQVVPSSLKWVSSNPEVASVDVNGLVTGLSQGSSTLMGTVNGQSVSYTINVTGNGTAPITNYLVKYRTHVQNVGWQAYVADGTMSGTSGRSLRLEGINISLDPTVSGGIEYRTHVQNVGWQSYVANNAIAGTSGQSLRLEGINIRLTGEAATKYDIYYRTHVQNIGWMAWAKNDETSGSAGYGYRLEGIQIQLVEKGGIAPSNSDANSKVAFAEI